MSNLNLIWQVYLCDETKSHNLDSNLSHLTRWFIETKYEKLEQDWEDLYHDLFEKVIKMRNSIFTGECDPIKNFKGWYYSIMKNYLINIVKADKRKERKLQKYKELLENENKGTGMQEREILERLAKIMSIQNNPKHVAIFVDFVKGVSYNELAIEHGVSKENARKIIERMRMECRKHWESEKIENVKLLLKQTEKEATFLFGRDRDEVMKSLVEKLVNCLMATVDER